MSVAVNVQVFGARGVVGMMDIFNKTVRTEVRRVVDKNAAAIANAARRAVPVRTGELRDTIRYEVEEVGGLYVARVLVGFGKLRRGRAAGQIQRLRYRPGRNREYMNIAKYSGKGVYAMVVEFGGGHSTQTDTQTKSKTRVANGKTVRRARPFLFPAFRQQRTPFDADLKRVLQSAAAGVRPGISMEGDRS